MSIRLMVTNIENTFCVPGPGPQPSALGHRQPPRSLLRKELAFLHYIKDGDGREEIYFLNTNNAFSGEGRVGRSLPPPATSSRH